MESSLSKRLHGRHVSRARFSVPPRDKSPPVCRVIQQTGCSSVAMVCKEAFSEW
jgi:hypothetical protein